VIAPVLANAVVGKIRRGLPERLSTGAGFDSQTRETVAEKSLFSGLPFFRGKNLLGLRINVVVPSQVSEYVQRRTTVVFFLVHNAGKDSKLPFVQSFLRLFHQTPAISIRCEIIKNTWNY